jgi:hypothetical protein
MNGETYYGLVTTYKDDELISLMVLGVGKGKKNRVWFEVVSFLERKALMVYAVENEAGERHVERAIEKRRSLIGYCALQRVVLA